MINKINNGIKRAQLLLKLKNIDIFESGIDREGDVYIKLKDGTTFFGPQSPVKYDKYLFRLFNLKSLNIKDHRCIQVALDVYIRYYNGALMYKGPIKQKNYQVNQGDVVSEMGAYQGFYAIKLAQQVGTSGKVLAIEVVPENYRLLQKNIKANHLNQIIAYNSAVWDENTNLIIKKRENDGQSSSIEKSYENAHHFTIKAKTLDTILQAVNIHHIDFMIIQLNGAEINALSGLQSLNPKNLSIAARYDTKGTDATKAVQELLLSRNYSVEIVEEDFIFAKHND